MPNNPNSGSDTKLQKPEPHRVVRSARKLLIDAADTLTVITNSMRERPRETIQHVTTKLDDGTEKSGFVVTQDNETVKILESFISSLRVTAGNLAEPIEILTPSKAVHLWNVSNRREPIPHAYISYKPGSGLTGKRKPIQ